MASSLSPDYPSNQSNGVPSIASQDKGPLSSLNLNFLKALTEKRTTRDGNPPKRRGPKPDSKPALTRRQELNRQAQRTHRERKELYIKALEDEVLRLKEIYSNVSQDKDRLAEENRQLRALLAQNGLSPPTSGPSRFLDDAISNPSLAGTSSGSVSGGAPPSSHTSFTPPPVSARLGTSPVGSGHQQGPHYHSSPQNGQAGVNTIPEAGPPKNPDIDYEQTGIDFVLSLEKPCMDHLPWLVERASGAGSNEPCGHALMASCPPEPFSDLTPDIPFGYSNATTEPASQGPGQRTWELSKGDLATLLDLSKRLDLDGEITPVMAWGMILAHPKLAELKAEDFARLTEELRGKVRCYGFGAVLEEFEVRDALETIFSTKDDRAMMY
ncbi:hypothetical protein VTK73DRAFT_2261 [Phialemonium thermophilum]|uniref:BZIP domain-containing protein n=1 Tax=Phialemonium thermophilum TaxID=223376 RepID=A0ABR3X5Z4_9PEZI